MNSQFEDAIFQAIGAEAGASDVLLRFEKENRPILDVVSGAEINFCVQPFSNFFKGERAADEACHFRVSPERRGKRQIRARPLTKTETPRLQGTAVHVESDLVIGIIAT
jgi:hypothetical protein